MTENNAEMPASLPVAGVPDRDQWTISNAASPADCYPKGPTVAQLKPGAVVHVWQEFPGFVVELGGYGDMTIVDPYTGRRMWMWIPDEFWSQGVIAAYRYAIDVADRVGFLSGGGLDDREARPAEQEAGEPGWQVGDLLWWASGSRSRRGARVRVQAINPAAPETQVIPLDAEGQGPWVDNATLRRA